MPITTQLLCLANSRKSGGRCVAGLAWNGKSFGVWVRPISQLAKGELTSERFYADHSEPKLLDVIELRLIKPKAAGCHVEDYIVDPSHRWTLVRKATFQEVCSLVSFSTAALWTNGRHTSNGVNDCIGPEDANKLGSSLRLVRPKQVTLIATSEGYRNTRKVRGSFVLGQFAYTLAVTDPVVEREFSTHEVGYSKVLKHPLLCISIGEIFEAQNAHYKLIAGVMESE